MAKEEVIVDIQKDGKFQVEFNHFVGDACYTESDLLQKALAAQGLDVEILHTTPKTPEVEMRKLENKQKVGAGS